MAKHAKQRRPEKLVAAENELQQEQNWRKDPHHYSDGRKIKTPVIGRKRWGTTKRRVPDETESEIDDLDRDSTYENTTHTPLTAKEKRKLREEKKASQEKKLDKKKY